MSTATGKPKLTGWAAAAAKAAPATPAREAVSPINPNRLANSSSKNKKVSLERPHGAAKDKDAPVIASAPAPAAQKKPKKPFAKPFNSQEVAEFLKKNYTQQATQPNTTVYSRPKSQGSPDWGTTTNNKWKSKKYACLNEVARHLRS
ncbi:LADA_0E11584g1_1 [Lachancea dasiensis]|uniref:LADA_0E11584g1_1 n=1 Tax=Lachancea dasiensis TaxID=1072105 RepID=A0A1G4JEZ9_9SACH|nr:LADA_0E11584g1_1 [Lachancea dasiensis]